jgi:hypothetical protein
MTFLEKSYRHHPIVTGPSALYAAQWFQGAAAAAQVFTVSLVLDRPKQNGVRPVTPPASLRFSTFNSAHSILQLPKLCAARLWDFA